MLHEPLAENLTPCRLRTPSTFGLSAGHEVVHALHESGQTHRSISSKSASRSPDPARLRVPRETPRAAQNLRAPAPDHSVECGTLRQLPAPRAATPD